MSNLKDITIFQFTSFDSLAYKKITEFQAPGSVKIFGRIRIQWIPVDPKHWKNHRQRRINKFSVIFWSHSEIVPSVRDPNLQGFESGSGNIYR